MCAELPSSRASEDSTSACTEQESTSSSSVSRTPTDGKSSPDTGRESRASRTWRLYDPSRTLMPDGEIMENWKEQDVANSLMSPSGTKSPLLTSSLEDSPAKTSASLDAAAASRVSDPSSSSRQPGSLTLFSEPEAGFSLRTFPDFFPPTVDEISPSYSRRWPSSGFTTSPGECWIADTSECPNEGAVSSSLPDVLEDDVPQRFYLSPRAAAGILRRAEKRGRELPSALAKALSALSTGKAEEPTTTTPKPDTSSPEPSAVTPGPAATTQEGS